MSYRFYGIRNKETSIPCSIETRHGYYDSVDYIVCDDQSADCVWITSNLDAAIAVLNGSGYGSSSMPDKDYEISDDTHEIVEFAIINRR